VNNLAFSKQTILGFDPGRDKCGLALMDTEPKLIYHQIVDSSKAIAIIQELVREYAIDSIVIGDGTTSKSWQDRLGSIAKVPIITVNEANSTLEARDRYWVMYPPQGIQQLIPRGLRVPPRPVDDIVAVLLIERYLGIGANSDSY
jgi:RNase H-fold protein (predicted Holliday junction resolvase)